MDHMNALSVKVRMDRKWKGMAWQRLILHCQHIIFLFYFFPYNLSPYNQMVTWDLYFLFLKKRSSACVCWEFLTLQSYSQHIRVCSHKKKENIRTYNFFKKHIYRKYNLLSSKEMCMFCSVWFLVLDLAILLEYRFARELKLALALLLILVAVPQTPSRLHYTPSW